MLFDITPHVHSHFNFSYFIHIHTHLYNCCCFVFRTKTLALCCVDFCVKGCERNVIPTHALPTTYPQLTVFQYFCISKHWIAVQRLQCAALCCCCCAAEVLKRIARYFLFLFFNKRRSLTYPLSISLVSLVFWNSTWRFYNTSVFLYISFALCFFHFLFTNLHLSCFCSKLCLCGCRCECVRSLHSSFYYFGMGVGNALLHNSILSLLTALRLLF